MNNTVQVGDTVRVRASDVLSLDRYYTVDVVEVSPIYRSTRFIVSGVSLSRSGIIPVKRPTHRSEYRRK